MSVPTSAKFVIKRHARRPYLRLLVKDSSGDPFDFTGAVDVKFVMKDEDDVLKIDAVATIESPPTTGVLRYEWAAGDTDTSGEFHAEFDVNYGAGEILTIPLDGDLLVRIYEDVNNA